MASASPLAESAPVKNFEPLPSPAVEPLSPRLYAIAATTPGSPLPLPLFDPSTATCADTPPVLDADADSDPNARTEIGTMAPAASATTGGSSTAAAAATTQAVPFQPHLLGVSAKSKLQLAKPLTAKARRIIAKKTSKLIKKRNEVDEWLRSVADRSDALKPTDFLPREHYVKLDDALARREARHLRTRTKALEDRERLYKWDPSTERKIDVDVFTELLFKFKRHLGSSLPDRDLPLKAGERDDDSSSNSSGDEDSSAECVKSHGESSSAGPDDEKEKGDEEDSEDDEAGGSSDISESSADSIDATIDDSDSDSNSDHSSSDSDSDAENTVGDKGLASANVDGAFDDHVKTRVKSNKRKLSDGQTDVTAEQGRRKKVKKAQKERVATGSNDTSTLESQSLQSSAPKLPSSAVGGISGNQTSIDSMPQSQQLPKITINDESANHQSDDDNKHDTTTSDSTSPPKSGSDAPSTGSTVPTSSPPDDTDVVLPWYKMHARRSLEDDFDDCVRDMSRRKPSKGRNEVQHGEMPEFMSGALITSPVRGDLPTPSTSSSPRQAPSPAKSSKLKSPGVSKTKPRQRHSSSLSHSVPHNKTRLAKASAQMTGH